MIFNLEQNMSWSYPLLLLLDFTITIVTMKNLPINYLIVSKMIMKISLIILLSIMNRVSCMAKMIFTEKLIEENLGSR